MPPLNCSGLAYSGVIACSVVSVGAGVASASGIQQFGDAEIQQLDDALFGHQDVLRLEVAMDHQVLVRVVDRGADREEKVAGVRER